MLIKVHNLIKILVLTISLLGVFNTAKASSASLEFVQYSGCTKFNNANVDGLFNSSNVALADDFDASGDEDMSVGLTLVFEGGAITNNSWTCSGGKPTPDKYDAISMCYRLNAPSCSADVCGVYSIKVSTYSYASGASVRYTSDIQETYGGPILGVVIATTSSSAVTLVHEIGHCCCGLSHAESESRIMSGDSEAKKGHGIVDYCPENEMYEWCLFSCCVSDF